MERPRNNLILIFLLLSSALMSGASLSPQDANQGTPGLGPARAVSPDDILGVWNNEEKDGRIQIYRCGSGYCGKIVWAKNAPETPKTDIHNPDPSLRSRPLIGLQIVNGFSYAGGNEWTGGTVYDPKNGKTYRGRMTLSSPDKLDLRGYVGIPLFGRTTSWTRQTPPELPAGP